MSDIPVPDQYDVGEMVVYKGALYRIDNIQRTHLGYQCYTIRNPTNGEFFHVPKHVLSKPLVQDILLHDVNWDESFDELLSGVPFNDSAPLSTDSIKVEPPATTVQSASSTRHATLDEAAIDDIAKARISCNSEKQTKWAVSLFKGVFLKK